MMKSVPILQKLNLRGVTLRNRMGLAAMSLYSASGGYLTSWHLMHYGIRSMGTGLVLVEATGVSPEGMVTSHDLGIWNDNFIDIFKRLTSFIHEQGAIAGIQLSHGGRKSSRTTPWHGYKWLKLEQGGWNIVAPSPIPFTTESPIPRELSLVEIGRIKADFISAAKRAYSAGFKLIELHAGHGRLLHSFYSPVSNQRTDHYGGSLENRVRLLVEIVQGIRAVLPNEYPLAVRLSCVDWVDQGWQLEDSIELANILRENGVDLIDCSSGGIAQSVHKSMHPGYQIPFAKAIRQGANIHTAAVGLITDPDQANAALENNEADIILFGRKMLLNPHFPLKIFRKFGVDKSSYPVQYQAALTSIKTQPTEHIPEL